MGIKAAFGSVGRLLNRLVAGILLLTIYPEIKRDVVSCLYESGPI